MKALRDKALAEIKQTDDAAALQAFRYWTWASRRLFRVLRDG